MREIDVHRLRGEVQLVGHFALKSHIDHRTAGRKIDRCAHGPVRTIHLHLAWLQRRALIDGHRLFGRSLQLRAILSHHERQHGMFRAGAMRRQLEPIFEKRLQHFGRIVFGRALRHLGHDVETGGGHPVGSGDLVGLHAVGIRHEGLQIEVKVFGPARPDICSEGQLPTASQCRQHFGLIQRRGRFDGGHFEGWLCLGEGCNRPQEPGRSVSFLNVCRMIVVLRLFGPSYH